MQSKAIHIYGPAYAHHVARVPTPPARSIPHQKHHDYQGCGSPRFQRKHSSSLQFLRFLRLSSARILLRQPRSSPVWPQYSTTPISFMTSTYHAFKFHNHARPWSHSTTISPHHDFTSPRPHSCKSLNFLQPHPTTASTNNGVSTPTTNCIGSLISLLRFSSFQITTRLRYR